MLFCPETHPLAPAKISMLNRLLKKSINFGMTLT